MSSSISLVLNFSAHTVRPPAGLIPTLLLFRTTCCDQIHLFTPSSLRPEPKPSSSSICTLHSSHPAPGLSRSKLSTANSIPKPGPAHQQSFSKPQASYFFSCSNRNPTPKYTYITTALAKGHQKHLYVMSPTFMLPMWSMQDSKPYRASHSFYTPQALLFSTTAPDFV